MNIQTFLFKLIMIVFYIARVTLLFAPLTILTVYSRQGGWKYGFTFIQNSLEVGIFMAFAFGFVIGLYHALSFELVGPSPNENYLKSRQVVRVRGHVQLEALTEAINEEFKLKDLKVSDSQISFRKLVYFLSPDKVVVNNLGDDLYEIRSEPAFKMFFIDFGRNFKTVNKLARIIKKNT